MTAQGGLQGSLLDVGDEVTVGGLDGLRRIEPGPRRVGRPAARLGAGVDGAVRRAGGRRPVARRAAPHVRRRGRGAAPAVPLRRGRRAAAPGAGRRTRRPEPPLRGRAWASPSRPPACASTATVATASRGTATRSAAGRRTTPWSRSCRSGRPARWRCDHAAAARGTGCRSATATWW
nr:hypothetical protein [Angustibacter aerolatus]